MRKMINFVLWALGVIVTAAIYFFVPIGDYTLFEHTLRIAATEPAQELGEGVQQTASDIGAAARDEWDERADIRREAAGAEEEADDDGPLRVRVERDGVHLGEEMLSPAQLRRRIREARHVASELHAILESAEGVPAPDVQGILELLREEDVIVDER